MGKSRSGPQTTRVINSNPAQEAFLPANQEASKQLLALLKRTDSFKGDLAASPDPSQLSALDQLQARLKSYQPGSTQLTNSLFKNAQDSADGVYTNPETNPFAKQSASVISRDLQRQFQDDIIPQLQSQAIGSGAYAGSAFNRDTERTSRNYAQTVSDAITKNFNGIYGQERTNQLNAGSQFQNAVTSGSLLDGLQAEIGGQRQGIQQNHLNQLYQQYQARNAPSPGVLAALGQQSPGLNQQSTTSPGGRGGGLAGGIAGGLGGFRAAQTLFPGAFAAGTASSLAGTATGTAAAVSGTAAGLGGGTAAAFLGGPIGWGAAGLGALLGSRIF